MILLWRRCKQDSNQRSAGRSLASRADASGGRAQGSARLGQQRRRAYTRVAEVVRGARQLRLFESIDVMVTYVSRCIRTGVLHNASILPNPIRSDRGREKECRPSGCCENTPSRNVLDQDRSQGSENVFKPLQRWTIEGAALRPPRARIGHQPGQVGSGGLPDDT